MEKNDRDCRPVSLRKVGRYPACIGLNVLQIFFILAVPCAELWQQNRQQTRVGEIFFWNAWQVEQEIGVQNFICKTAVIINVDIACIALKEGKVTSVFGHIL